MWVSIIDHFDHIEIFLIPLKATPEETVLYHT